MYFTTIHIAGIYPAVAYSKTNGKLKQPFVKFEISPTLTNVSPTDIKDRGG